MSESQLAGVQHLSRNRDAGFFGDPYRLAASVNFIAEERIAQVLKMDPNLMRSTGMDLRLAEGRVMGKSLQRAVRDSRGGLSLLPRVASQLCQELLGKHGPKMFY